jgi:hypothetical protein
MPYPEAVDPFEHLDTDEVISRSTTPTRGPAA